jgi:hypothetical protein
MHRSLQGTTHDDAINGQRRDRKFRLVLLTVVALDVDQRYLAQRDGTQLGVQAIPTDAVPVVLRALGTATSGLCHPGIKEVAEPR